MSTIKNLFFMLTFGIFLFLSPACSNRQENQQNAEVSEVPPSVSGPKGAQQFLRLSDKEKEELKIETGVVSGSVQQFSLISPGLVFPAPGHMSIISTPIDGRISEVIVREGQLVKKGQELFKIESLVYGNMVAEYLQAVAEEKFQTTRLERMKQLVEQTISSKSELDRAMSDYQRATAASIAAFAKLRAIGVPDHEIEALNNAGQIDPVLKIHAPIGGSFDQRLVDHGQSVNALEKLGRIIDLKKVLVKGYFSPEDARLISPGDSVKISRREDDSLQLHSVVVSVNPGLDEDNRSVVVNVEAAPKNNWPKPGENVRLKISTSSLKTVLTVPLKAITYDGNQPVVFVKKDENTFEKRIIEIEELRGEYAVVKSGLKKDEEFAVSQVFSLKALSRFELIAEE